MVCLSGSSHDLRRTNPSQCSRRLLSIVSKSKVGFLYSASTVLPEILDSLRAFQLRIFFATAVDSFHASCAHVMHPQTPPE